MNKILVSITISSIFLFGCSNSNDSSSASSDVTSDTSAMIEAPLITDAPAQMQSTDSTMIVTSPVSPTGVPAQAVTSNNSGPNPAHGEPGHRCDIAVGAPLNSTPTAPAAQPAPGATAPVTATATATAPATAPAPVATAPGTNPAHGQPGHDCKIAVGAPLPK